MYSFYVTFPNLAFNSTSVFLPRENFSFFTYHLLFHHTGSQNSLCNGHFLTFNIAFNLCSKPLISFIFYLLQCLSKWWLGPDDHSWTDTSSIPVLASWFLAQAWWWWMPLGQYISGSAQILISPGRYQGLNLKLFFTHALNDCLSFFVFALLSYFSFPHFSFLFFLHLFFNWGYTSHVVLCMCKHC